MTSRPLSILDVRSAGPAGRALCVEETAVFQHPLLEDPPASAASAEDRRRHAILQRRAEQTCLACPLLAGCLYDAVVRHDVAGYVGGTTARERARIRTLLGITVEPENLDTLAGVIGGNRPVDHDEVVRLRAAHPDESLERLAHRLGCSLSTVKRHLRRERNGGRTREQEPRSRPSVRDVLAAARTVLDPARGSRRAA